MSLIHGVEGHKVVMGDFNATPFSRLDRQFAVSSGLNLAWLPSWPAFFALPQLGIDHIFLSPGLRVLKEPVIGESAPVRTTIPSLRRWGAELEHHAPTPAVMPSPSR